MEKIVAFTLVWFFVGSFGSELWNTAEKRRADKPKLNSSQLSNLPVGDQTYYDINDMLIITEYTSALEKALGLTEQIVISGYGVEDYTPSRGDDAINFWKSTITPNIMQTIVQDVKGRDMVTKAFSAITDLAIIIEKGVDILRDSQGSKKAIEIVQRNIPAQLAKLNHTLLLVDWIENGAITLFANQTKEIFDKITGPQNAHFIEQKSEQESVLAKLVMDRQDIFSTLADKQANITRFEVLIKATLETKGAKQSEKDQFNKQSEEINRLNNDIQQKINNIPTEVPVTVHESGGWWFWRWHEDYTTMVQNPNRKADADYYQSLIDARNDKFEKESKTKQEQLDKLNNQLSDLQFQYNRSVENFHSYFNTSKSLIEDKNKLINSTFKKIDEIEKTQTSVEKDMGSKGSTLISCLTQIRTYAKKLGASPAFSPLEAIISEDIELLVSDNERDIFVATSHLQHAVTFISDYAVQAGKAVNAISDEYKKIVNSDRVQSYLAIEGIEKKF